MNMGQERGSHLNGMDGTGQVRKVLSLIERHVTECQKSSTIGKLVIELEFIRGGKDGSRVKSPKIKYNGTWEFLDKVEGLG